MGALALMSIVSGGGTRGGWASTGAPALYQRGRVAWENGDYAQAVEWLEAAVASGANDYPVHHLLGVALLHEGRLEEARRSLTQAVAHDAAHPQDHRLLGDIYLTQERFALAAEAYAQVQRLGLDDAALHFQLATAYHRLGNDLGQVGRQSIPGGQPGTIREGVYLLEALPGGNAAFEVCPPQSAVFQVQRATDLGLDSPELHLLLGAIWLEARRFDRAVAVYRAVEPRVPETHRAEYCSRYARALLGVGDREGHLANLQEAVARDPSAYTPLLEQGYLRVAELYSREGDGRQYLDALRRGAERVPGSSDLHYRLGNALWDDGQGEEAARQWRITLELNADHPDRTRLLELIQKVRPSNRP